MLFAHLAQHLFLLPPAPLMVHLLCPDGFSVAILREDLNKAKAVFATIKTGKTSCSPL
ncbi:hypothetical protein Q3V30_12375 [Erwinia pyri]|uniref:Uncharacterized protein n=1 Tax=Erwinia pyri TaxID=3062598 RepID=A0AA50HKR4_9GAMM|nr:hypothetical protein [Erwinia sp. DE2]WLS77286.1 hypothetical protein Q3V30_12375 [Erwinia sp. DE2]